LSPQKIFDTCNGMKRGRGGREKAEQVLIILGLIHSLWAKKVSDDLTGNVRNIFCQYAAIFW